MESISFVCPTSVLINRSQRAVEANVGRHAIRFARLLGLADLMGPVTETHRLSAILRARPEHHLNLLPHAVQL